MKKEGLLIPKTRHFFNFFFKPSFVNKITKKLFSQMARGGVKILLEPIFKNLCPTIEYIFRIIFGKMGKFVL